MPIRDKIMSGAYDWIIFPAGLAFIAFMVAGLWRDYRFNREKLLKCEQTAIIESSREHFIACRLAPVGHAASAKQ
jgi:hypothetical protein